MDSDLQVGAWQVSVVRGEISSDGVQLPLEPRVMGLLVYLAEHSDEVLSKERLIQAVWPDTFVSDDVLTSAIWKLRHALGDDPKQPRFVRTYPRRGYQLICEVVFPEPEHVEVTERYELDRKLGEGGMGEVYLARDLELGRPLALKFLRPDFEADERYRRRLRREARAAALLDHPFICKIYDTGRLNGRDFIAMEYLEGERLSDRLLRGPLPVAEAVRIALEITEALEAAHRHGIVHRDIKPSNVIRDTQGHVKVTDFGIAKKVRRGETGEGDWTETRSEAATTGTPAYMSPEQIRLDPVDHRTDLFLLGIVLYEMLTGIHPFRRKTQAETAAAILREEPVPLSSFVTTNHLGPLEAAVRRLLAKDPDHRFQLAGHLHSCLTGILRSRVARQESGAEGTLGQTAALEEQEATPVEVRPYPGLSPFSVEQAEYFFGREMEVQKLWKRLRRRSLLGIIGPSGAGKSSFLRAGLIPAAPDGWKILIATPGDRPFVSLAQALSEELAGDPALVKELLRFEEPDIAVSLVMKWRNHHSAALIIVDQFEELFTLNLPGVQQSFIELIGRLAKTTGVQLLLSMRDDFLFHCHGFKCLAPIFDNLSPIGPLSGQQLRRAIVQPAEKCGFHFEDEGLIEELITAVQGERGTLPLLAFAAAEMWEQRDVERKRLTRKAYQTIGGVAGALSRHAETTLERIGLEDRPIARELFRNLITSKGTRSIHSREELLSVFEDEQMQRASHVLTELIDARLLVSYRLPSADRAMGSEQRIEIVHESLLDNWPRLVRWQTQDADGAQLRDELIKVAQVWDLHGRSPDFLWSGTAFSEFKVWRSRYPGGLTDLEEAFAEAMTWRARRGRRQRNLILAAIVVIAGLVAITTSTLWHRAMKETLRAEAAHLLTEARSVAESDPTAAVAYATKSLELADQEVTRVLIARILSQGPIAFSCATELDVLDMEFSPDGKILVGSGHASLHQVWHSNGAPSERLNVHNNYVNHGFSSDSRYMVSWARDQDDKEFVVWKLPELQEINRFRIDRNVDQRIHPDGILGFTEIEGASRRMVQFIPFEDGPVKDLGEWPWMQGFNFFHLGSEKAKMVLLVDKDNQSDLHLVTGLPDNPTPPRKFAETNGIFWRAGFLSSGTRFATYDAEKTINIWNLSPAESTPLSTFEGPRKVMNDWSFDERGQWLAMPNGADNAASVWDLSAPVSFGPQVLRHGDRATSGIDVHPQGKWVAVGDSTTVSLWPLRRTYPSVLFELDNFLQQIVFDPNSCWVALSTFDGTLNVWSLESEGDGRRQVLFECGGILDRLSVSPDGELIAVAQWKGTIHLVPTSGGQVRELTDFQSIVGSLAFDESGKRLAAAAGGATPSDAGIRVWNLETGKVQLLDPVEPRIFGLRFEGDDHLYTFEIDALRKWNLSSGTSEVLVAGAAGPLSPDGRYYLGMKKDGLIDPGYDLRVYDLDQGTSWQLAAHGGQLWDLAWHPNSKAIITSSYDGMIRISSLKGDQVHLLGCHPGRTVLAVDPRGRWLASAGKADGIFRLWPIPDLSNPPLYTLPYNELIERLKSMTNYRVVEDPDSPARYRIEFGPLPGWDELPKD